MDIEVKQLSVTFLSPMGAVRVLRDVNLLFHGGKITALLGESGSGKSILGTAIMRLLPENARMTGSIFYDGNDIPRLSEKEMNEIRGDRIGWIAQDPISAMDPLMRVGRQGTEILLLSSWKSTVLGILSACVRPIRTSFQGVWRSASWRR